MHRKSGAVGASRNEGHRKKIMTQLTNGMFKLNPAWIAYNNAVNEGGEGFNPHPKFIQSAPAAAASAARMIVGKRRTHAEAVKFAKNCLSGAQKEHFMLEVRNAFPENY